MKSMWREYECGGIKFIVKIEEKGNGCTWVELYTSGNAPYFLEEKFVKKVKLIEAIQEFEDLKRLHGNMLYSWTDNPDYVGLGEQIVKKHVSEIRKKEEKARKQREAEEKFCDRSVTKVDIEVLPF